jgi:hypothetical protein
MLRVHSFSFSKLIGTTVGAVLLAMGLFGLTGFVQTPAASAHGCDRAFWKNNTETWGRTNYFPSQKVGETFSGALPSLASKTFLEALQGDGGPRIAGAQDILLRQAVAALLNSTAVPDYGLESGDITYLVNTALRTGNRSTILAQADDLKWRNDRECEMPLYAVTGSGTAALFRRPLPIGGIVYQTLTFDFHVEEPKAGKVRGKAHFIIDPAGDQPASELWVNITCLFISGYSPTNDYAIAHIRGVITKASNPYYVVGRGAFWQADGTNAITGVVTDESPPSPFAGPAPGTCPVHGYELLLSGYSGLGAYFPGGDFSQSHIDIQQIR